MSSSQKQTAQDINLGRHHIHAELDRSKNLPGVQQGLQTGLPLQTGLAQQGFVQQGFVQQGFAQQQLGGSIQTTTLISNDPKSVISQQQRIAANMPITTEKHVTVEYVPVIHEELVTKVPVVTGQAVHTGQALAGQSYVQQVNTEMIQQEAATKIDLIPEVSTQLSAQQVVNVASTGQTQYVGQANVIPSQQFVQQQKVVQETVNVPVTQERVIQETVNVPVTTEKIITETQQVPTTQLFQQQGYQQQGIQKPIIGQPLKKF